MLYVNEYSVFSDAGLLTTIAWGINNEITYAVYTTGSGLEMNLK